MTTTTLERVQGCETRNLVRNRTTGLFSEIVFDKNGDMARMPHLCINWQDEGRACPCGKKEGRIRTIAKAMWKLLTERSPEKPPRGKDANPEIYS